MKHLLQIYLRNLYQRTMREAYSLAHDEIIDVLGGGGECLDCGAYHGQKFAIINEAIGLDKTAYHGIEWNEELVNRARQNGLDLVKGDLNKTLDFPENRFRCVFALSVLEHLLNPCRFIRETYRVLEPGGTLVLLTPNISTYFTLFQILLGKMPSSGPHPDSDQLLKQEEMFKVSDDSLQPDTESEMPAHRHLVIFSYRVLIDYCRMAGFSDVRGRGFGVYPFPNFIQPILEKLDPYHCHQMVIVARK
jgi:SAM-dependent methyltransferase